MKVLSFRVASTSVAEHWYRVRVLVEGQHVQVTCDCMAGQFGRFCAHRDAVLLHGEKAMVHPQDGPRVRKAIQFIAGRLKAPPDWQGSWKGEHAWRGMAPEEVIAPSMNGDIDGYELVSFDLDDTSERPLGSSSRELSKAPQSMAPNRLDEALVKGLGSWLRDLVTQSGWTVTERKTPWATFELTEKPAGAYGLDLHAMARDGVRHTRLQKMRASWFGTSKATSNVASMKPKDEHRIHIRVQSQTQGGYFHTLSLSREGRGVKVSCSCKEGSALCAHQDAVLVAQERAMVHREDIEGLERAHEWLKEQPLAELTWNGAWRRNFAWRGLAFSFPDVSQDLYVRERSHLRPGVYFTKKITEAHPEMVAQAEAHGWVVSDKVSLSLDVIVAVKLSQNETLRAVQAAGIPILSVAHWRALLRE